jgi:hypothetical protein
LRQQDEATRSTTQGTIRRQGINKTRGSKERSKRGKKRKKRVRVRKGEEKSKKKGENFNSMIQTPKSKQHKTLEKRTHTMTNRCEHK